MDAEVWIDVVGFEGLYEVSNKGRVKSLPRVVECIDGRIRPYKKERILRPGFNAFGYPQVVLRRDNKSFVWRVHRLVAIAFVPNPDNKPWINHIDGDPTNNSVENIEWCTPSENTRHALGVLGRKFGGWPNHVFGEKHASAVGVIQMKEGVEINRFWCMMDAARNTNTNFRHIWDCCNGRYKSTNGFQWKYA